MHVRCGDTQLYGTVLMVQTLQRLSQHLSSGLGTMEMATPSIAPPSPSRRLT
jgi:hypothetical protein